MNDHPAIEMELWGKLNTVDYESSFAKKDLNAGDVLKLLDYTTYFNLTNTTLPSETDKIIHYLLEEGLVVPQDDSLYTITNLGVILFAKKLTIDNPPCSKNEALAALMRRMGICEERGSGWDMIALSCEKAQLPVPNYVPFWA
jgi:predicted HTH transcriptional regulator